jgi:serine/threonine protein kinase
MGEVYLAEHPRLSRLDAIKVLSDALSSNKDFAERFQKEAELTAGLWHPHIVGVHDRGEADGHLWISMDFVDGIDAAELLAESPDGLPVEDVASIVEAIGEALDFAHQRGLIHRDVKPANILMTTSVNDPRRILLADFGIGREVEKTTSLTATNMTLGTVFYAAPEQLMGEALDGRSDQYALAATAFHLLTGEPVFDDSNPTVVISRHLNAPPPSLAETRPELAALDPVLQRGLAKNPAERYATCTEFASAFRDAAWWVTHEPDSPAVSATAPTQLAPIVTPSDALLSTTPAPKAKRRWWFVGGAVAVAAATAIATVVYWPSFSALTPLPRTGPLGPTPTSVVALPPNVASARAILIGTSVPFIPAEFRDPQGRMVGFDVELINAVASKLGLTTQIKELAFADVIPSVRNGTVDVGVAGVTDTKAREELVDFVTYYQGGTLWAQRPGPPINPDEACGLTVAVQATTIQQTDEMPALNQKCVAANKPPIKVLPVTSVDDAATAVVDSRADAFAADSPVTGYAVKLSNGGLITAGQMIDPAPWGFVVAKGSPLGPALQDAIEQLIASGRYGEILNSWGVSMGAVSAPAINGAVN